MNILLLQDLKLLLFGSVNKDFSEEWKYQGFTFSDVKRLQYGFVQKKVSLSKWPRRKDLKSTFMTEI